MGLRLMCKFCGDDWCDGECRRTPEQERADVVAMLQGQIDYWHETGETEKKMAAMHCQMRVLNGEHVGAASKGRR